MKLKSPIQRFWAIAKQCPQKDPFSKPGKDRCGGTSGCIQAAGRISGSVILPSRVRNPQRGLGAVLSVVQAQLFINEDANDYNG
jgi:hypothetical protein